MVIEGPLSHASISVSRTRARQTPQPPSARFGQVLRAGGEALVAGAQAALNTLPGGQVLCAAVRGAVDPRGGLSSSVETAAGPGSAAAASGARAEGDQDLWSVTQESQAFNLMYLQLQEEMARENRRYAAMSNVLKTRHETARSIISNV